MRALLAQIDLPSLGGEGPEDVTELLTGFYVLFGLGFFVAVIGHITKLRALQAAGIAMVMIGTVAFMVAVGSSG